MFEKDMAPFNKVGPKPLENMLRDARRFDQFGNEYYLPDHKRNVVSIKNRILPILRSERPTVVFSFDAINIYQFNHYFDGKIDLSRLETLSTVFPTGSATAYSSIHFGLPVNQHGVYGSAFYNPLIEDLQLVFSDEAADRSGNLYPSRFLIEREATLDVSGTSSFIYVKHFSADATLAKKFMGKSEPLELSSTGDFREDIVNQLEVLRSVTDKNERPISWCYLDFDTIMHQWGVMTRRTDNLLNETTSRISDFIASHSNHNFIFLSDHGQIDQNCAHEFDNNSILSRCYAMKGGSGRTLFFYTNDSSVYDHVKSEVGNSGLVLTRGDPLLDNIFGFKTKDIAEIGDIVAIATNPGFPSYGWDLKAEHGGLCKEEVYVPFLIMQND